MTPKLTLEDSGFPSPVKTASGAKVGLTYNLCYDVSLNVPCSMGSGGDFCVPKLVRCWWFWCGDDWGWLGMDQNHSKPFKSCELPNISVGWTSIYQILPAMWKVWTIPQDGHFRVPWWGFNKQFLSHFKAPISLTIHVAHAVDSRRNNAIKIWR